MNYKRWIKSRTMRIKIMQMLSFVPDAWMVRLQYRIKTGRKLNLKNPQRFTEKLQWYKLYYRDPLMKQCVDKWDVREYVNHCGLGHILNKCFGVYDSPEEIDFDALPDSFVIKDTLGGGGNAVILVEDKRKLDWKAACRQMQRWVDEPYGVKNPGREWVYDGRKHRIILEEYLHAGKENGGLIEYKFFCCQGEVQCVYGMANRSLGSEVEIGIFNPDFQLLPYRRAGKPPLKHPIAKPSNYDEMLDYVRRLSRAFPHARVDFYDQEGQIRFGEITFFNASGYMLYEPDEFDFILGERFVLPKTMRRECA